MSLIFDRSMQNVTQRSDWSEGLMYSGPRQMNEGKSHIIAAICDRA